MLDRIRVSSGLDGSACSWRTVIRVGSTDRSEDTDAARVANLSMVPVNEAAATDAAPGFVNRSCRARIFA